MYVVLATTALLGGLVAFGASWIWLGVAAQAMTWGRMYDRMAERGHPVTTEDALPVELAAMATRHFIRAGWLVCPGFPVGHDHVVPAWRRRVLWPLYRLSQEEADQIGDDYVNFVRGRPISLGSIEWVWTHGGLIGCLGAYQIFALQKVQADYHLHLVWPGVHAASLAFESLDDAKVSAEAMTIWVLSEFVDKFQQLEFK